MLLSALLAICLVTLAKKCNFKVSEKSKPFHPRTGPLNRCKLLQVIKTLKILSERIHGNRIHAQMLAFLAVCTVQCLSVSTIVSEDERERRTGCLFITKN